MTDFLVSGTGSGFGRHARDVFGAQSWDRDTPDGERQWIIDSGVDVVIHSAFNSSPTVDSDNAAQYVRDNLQLTADLLSVPCGLFVFLSTVDVYPRDGARHIEDEVIDLNETPGIYGMMKLMSEGMVRERKGRHLVLRCSSLLGQTMRCNTLTRLLDGERKVGLSSSSRFNYVRHTDVSDFIDMASGSDLSGTFNVASGDDVSFLDVAAQISPNVEFGSYVYDCGLTDNSKIIEIAPAFARSSLETVTTFINERTGDR